MSARKRVPDDIQQRVLDRSRRRCALCIHFDNDWDQKEGQLAHLDRDPSNFAEDNLVFLCLPHHDDYDTKRRQTKNLTIHEAKTARDRLYKFIEAGGDLAKAGQQSNQPAGIRERQVDTLAKLVPDLRKAVGYLQGMTSLARLKGEISPEEYCRRCSAAVTSAHATFEEGQLFLPPEFAELCEKFFASVIEAQGYFAHTQVPGVIGNPRALAWKAAGNIAYDEAPLILRQIEAAARSLIK
ncbi:MAG: hypothetical protein ACRELF_13720 [Gemmataceae bacterium]